MQRRLRLLCIGLMTLLGLQTAATETRSKKTAPPQAKTSAPVAANPQVAVPEAAKLRLLIYTSLIAINQANLTGNYTVLRDLGAPAFREANTSARLVEIFSGLRRRNIDLSPILLLDPKLVRPPAFMDNGLLRLSGFFPSAPEQVNFDLAFQSVEGRWALFAVALNTSSNVAAQAPPGQMPAGPSERAPASNAAAAANASAAPPGKVPGWIFFGVNTDPSAVGETAPTPGSATGKPAQKR